MARAFDITEEASYEQLIGFTAKEFGGLDGLFNVAAALSLRRISAGIPASPRCLSMCGSTQLTSRRPGGHRGNGGVPVLRRQRLHKRSNDPR